MGVRPQLLAARFNDYFSVVVGTTLGTMLADGPAVWCGEKVTRLVPLRVVRIVSALFFAVLGGAALMLHPGGAHAFQAAGYTFNAPF